MFRANKRAVLWLLMATTVLFLGSAFAQKAISDEDENPAAANIEATGAVDSADIPTGEAKSEIEG